ncbi:MAG: PilX N-terminal domain-containing pilus assembly protein [Gallionella sp.]|nr:PilX N-terminal domain-containing pilus assembly protein [Gallionella sp.]
MTKAREVKDMPLIHTYSHLDQRCHPQRGASLIMVMLILVVVSLLGVGGAQIALMSERGARNDRDHQVAWQAAEAALIDAEYELGGPAGSSTRKALFDGVNVTAFPPGCGTSGTSVGLCTRAAIKPAWLTVDFTVTGSSAATTEFGAFTGRTFAAGGVGIQPAKKPRYIIEAEDDPYFAGKVVYRVTAMGFGPRADIQAMLQVLYRI